MPDFFRAIGIPVLPVPSNPVATLRDIARLAVERVTDTISVALRNHFDRRCRTNTVQSNVP
jgi:hypothetical protein